MLSKGNIYPTQRKPFEIRGRGEDGHAFEGSVYDFLCEVHDENIDSDYGRQLFTKLEQKFAAEGGIIAHCKYQDIDGEMTPTMSLPHLKNLLFKLDDKDVKKARRVLSNITFATIINPVTKEILDNTSTPKNVLPPMDPKAQPVYYKLQLIADQDPIRGVTHTNEDGVTDIHWGVFDFLCIMYEHNTTDAFGRKKFEQINKARNGDLETLVTRIKTRKAGKNTPTLTADQLIDLSMMYKHPHALMVREACTYLERVARDYTRCAEVTVDEDA